MNIILKYVFIPLAAVVAAGSVSAAQSFTPVRGAVSSAATQDDVYDVFVPITKYMAQGDAEKLSAWFADNLEISVISTSNDSSRNQAKQILKSFFDTYTPRSFEITHRAGRSNMKYALGTLNAGGEVFMVTIFVSYSKAGYKIQQLKIDRIK